MRELKIGDAVKTPAGNQVVIALTRSYVITATRADVDTLYARDALYPHEWTRDKVEPLPADIPYERAMDLYLAANKRLAQLQVEGEERARVELATFVEALRLLLEGDHG